MPTPPRDRAPPNTNAPPQPDFIEKSVPIVPISGWMGDNLIKKSEKMAWWNGMEVKTLDDRTVKVETLLNALNDMAIVPERKVGLGGLPAWRPEGFRLGGRLGRCAGGLRRGARPASARSLPRRAPLDPAVWGGARPAPATKRARPNGVPSPPTPPCTPPPRWTPPCACPSAARTRLRAWATCSPAAWSRAW